MYSRNYNLIMDPRTARYIMDYLYFSRDVEPVWYYKKVSFRQRTRPVLYAPYAFSRDRIHAPIQIHMNAFPHIHTVYAVV